MSRPLFSPGLGGLGCPRGWERGFGVNSSLVGCEGSEGGGSEGRVVLEARR